MKLIKRNKPMPTEKLFSYGTLQLEAVQLKTFNRKLIGHKDILMGYQLDQIKIEDQEVIKISGTDTHLVLNYTGNMADQVIGTVFDITKAELAAADEYEVDDYKRIEVKLSSGIHAWVYIAAKSKI
jgi:gamma-glutamylcyclotransferase (GGCT)/AIG2-like uncharacterized protein YtfP